MRCLWAGARSATLLLEENGYYETEKPYSVLLNGEPAGERRTAVASFFGLTPATVYRVTALRSGEPAGETAFTTLPENATLDVRAFGAGGDGAADDTAAVQAALSACPYNGRVLVPAGTYLVSPLFLKSRTTLELASGATLLLTMERGRFPVLPAFAPAVGGTELPLGTWEGEPRPMYAALLNGLGVTDVTVCGSGVLDGQARRGGWWTDPKAERGPRRGRMIFLSRCRNVTVQGLTVRDSPSWNVHPHYSDNLRFFNLSVLAPADSPNTDGLNPESCGDVQIAGVRFSLGDDCIAVKAGKAWMAEHFPKPCERVDISHCLMENGHGGVTVGSETSCGVRDVTVRRCEMRDTDRGLRVKTRRGRCGIVDRITLEHVLMERVRVPFAVNCFYHCDADGRAPEVQDRAPRPVGDGTPAVGTLAFRDVVVSGCGACACYALGLPERPIGALEMERVDVAYAWDAAPYLPVMAEGVAPLVHGGIVAENVKRLSLRDVRLRGPQGKPLSAANVERVEGDVET